MPAPRIFTPGTTALGTPQFRVPQPQRGPLFAITGVTRDSTGAALGSYTVKLFRTATDVFVDSTVSDVSGNYSFPNVTSQDAYYLVAYLEGSPDVEGTTDNTLIGASA